eukprot:CAMPEP_0205827820 /NCGR_PEP_ID=MMETSP0206-20130828/33152_1 /ASSEMBLY_ACC=CAM_ASM_000279 /TAXON_ID=36767 /ORGANISM="Euplotes focardii, Strain TN1" /LENGTH=283 /DNA_ID=CAMNT_0053129049 /DNA_START=138 /DNA_END=989 /DNA_ORIENTATION=+
MGVGVFAGPPFWCAHGSAGTALTACMAEPELIVTSRLLDATYHAARSAHSIDDPKHLANARVWLFAGDKDTVVKPGVVNKTGAYYKHFLASASRDMSLGSYPAEHAWITDSFGNDCKFLGTPYINNCAFDAPGALLQHLYRNTLRPRGTANPANLLTFHQQLYTPVMTPPSLISLGPVGFAYIPAACLDLSVECSLHITLHGCKQGQQEVGATFASHAGLNEWAEANHIVVLYPQARVSVWPFNPQGCWDWWGYTGPAYATKYGPQVASVARMIAALAGSFDV